MTDELDKHRDELRAIAAEMEAAKSLPTRRTVAVQRAREAKMTWREASILLGMTEHGLIKAANTAAAKPSPDVKVLPDEIREKLRSNRLSPLSGHSEGRTEWIARISVLDA